jgi:hypothetical protein
MLGKTPEDDSYESKHVVFTYINNKKRCRRFCYIVQTPPQDAIL